VPNGRRILKEGDWQVKATKTEFLDFSVA
jgi:hypothetical protein